jgi:hypothetical protein
MTNLHGYTENVQYKKISHVFCYLLENGQWCAACLDENHYKSPYFDSFIEIRNWIHYRFRCLFLKQEE